MFLCLFCLAFLVPFCILPVYDLEPYLGFLCLIGFIIYLLFIDQKKKKNIMSFINYDSHKSIAQTLLLDMSKKWQHFLILHLIGKLRGQKGLLAMSPSLLCFDSSSAVFV